MSVRQEASSKKIGANTLQVLARSPKEELDLDSLNGGGWYHIQQPYPAKYYVL